ncbi:hypothetical protein SDC9_212305 [bioreactor metagenome]|uniref:Uncharacterized protein n=1 Tax=bioreactor metagenome TaxID=1076179 RepID=A0A645JN59_9ZZZZ
MSAANGLRKKLVIQGTAHGFSEIEVVCRVLVEPKNNLIGGGIQAFSRVYIGVAFDGWQQCGI